MSWTKDLYRDLCGLSVGEFDEVLDALGEQRRFITEGAPRATRALEVVRRVEKDQRVRAEVEAVLKTQGTLGGWQVTQAWLDAVYRRCSTIPIVGSRAKKRFRLPIEEIYVPLALAPGGPGSRDIDEHENMEDRRSGVGRPIDEIFALLERRVTAGAQLRGVAVVGDPGSGKTTLLKHIFCRVRRGERMGLPRDLTPVFLRFTHVAPIALNPTPGLLLPRMIAQAARRHPGAHRAVRPQAGPFLFLLDGLDEVSDEAARLKVAVWLEEEMEDWPGSWFVVSCRRAAWRRAGQELYASLMGLHVLNFGKEDRARYVRDWFRLVERDYADLGLTDQERAERAELGATALLKTLETAQGTTGKKLRDMASNPLLLSNICLVQFGRGRLPQARVRLYEECLDLLLQGWARHQQLDRGLPAEDGRLALAPVAWAMQEASDGQSPTQLPRRRVLALLDERLRQLPALQMAASEFLRRANEDCGVLVESDLGQHRFPHLTFQEYLSALDAVDRDAVAELAERAHESRWHEPILLSMGLPGVFRPFMQAALDRPDVPDLKELLRACLDESRRMDPAPFVRLLRQAATDAGRVSAATVVLELLRTREMAGVTEAARALVDHPDAALRAQARSLCGLPTAPRADRPPADPAPGTLWRASGLGIEFVWVPPGRFLMGATTQEGAEGYDPGAYSYEEPPHRVRITKGFWLGRFPVTVAQYRAFVAASDDVEEPPSFRDSDFNQDEQPVTWMSWHDARRFCAWLGDQLQAEVELPTEAEWEWAARGKDGRRYPWGNADPDPQRANFTLSFGSARLEPVGGRPLGRGPFNAEEQAGGVWEWCRDVYVKYPTDGAEIVDICRHNDASEAPRVLRGGSWAYSNPGILRCANRDWGEPEVRRRLFGFRLCVRFPPQHAL
ncbi:MAG: SUMF1/EgtB/PvdO family nonheme iron enzyme [Alphaproteobacteria bacterium]|nr:SUMF1/EgtB/PvdO family nonheme iron enzyme [Alphaproteobacteria bacterium]